MVLIGLGAAAIVVYIIWYVLQVIAYWKIFEKAGKPGWHSIIPFLNLYDQYELSWNGTMGIVAVVLFILTSAFSVMMDDSSGVSAMTVVGLLVMLAQIVFTIIGDYKLSKAFGKGVGFCIGLIILEPIFKLILGFGDARYIGPDNGQPRGYGY